MSRQANSILVDPVMGSCKVSGREFRAIGFGTYPLEGDVCSQSVKKAVQTGYHFIDTATYYKNFVAIAKALERHDRQDFYITSKVWHDMLDPKNVRKDFEDTLHQLEIDYLDAYLVHWPNSKIPIEKTLFAMEELRAEKKLHHIGLSNVSTNHLAKALECKISISWVQVEMHPHFCDFDLLQFCAKHAIVIQAWRPLNSGRVLKDPLLIEIGNRYGKTASQVALKWIVQQGCIPLPGSSDSSHITENFHIFDFSLSGEEMSLINKQAEEGERFRLKEEHELGFTDEFDFSYEECWKGR